MKELQRKELLAQRNALALADVKAKGAVISEKLWTMAKDNAETVMVYIPASNETDIYPFIEQCLSHGKRIAAPICGENRTLLPSIITDLDKDLAPGTFDILAPKVLTPVPLEEIDFVVVPGVGFSSRGDRLGFGAGYYDRFLPKLREDSRKVAVCYSFQVCDDIVGDSWDYPMDAVVTEEKTYWFSEEKRV